MIMENQEKTVQLVPLAEAARILGIAHQTLSQYLKAGKLTVTPAGGVRLVDPNITRQELEKAGFYRRKESRRARWHKD